jgi:hypothetical protein
MRKGEATWANTSKADQQAGREAKADEDKCKDGTRKRRGERKSESKDGTG